VCCTARMMNCLRLHNLLVQRPHEPVKLLVWQGRQPLWVIGSMVTRQLSTPVPSEEHLDTSVTRTAEVVYGEFASGSLGEQSGCQSRG